MRNKTTLAIFIASALAFSGGLAGCNRASNAQGEDVTLKYWLWDSAQMPAYQSCIDDFEELNPNIDVELEQYGWDDYWTQITAGMVAEAAPDVFIDHTQQFGKFMGYGQLLDLTPYIERDGLDLEQYQPGLTQMWEAPDGEMYGLPKDWDAEGVFYNIDLVAQAGYTTEDLWNLTWNPDDGGTFEQFIAHLTIDKNGVRGDEEGFDKTQVETYGFAFTGGAGGYGQTQWSPFLLTTGWTYADKNPWGTVWNYDDDRFKQTLEWYYSLIEKGYMPTQAQISSGVGALDSFVAGAYATLIEGSWNTNTIASGAASVQVMPNPIGVNGQRASVVNSVGDSIYKGTPHPEEAWQFVKYMASAQCQNKVAEYAVVFPSITESSQLAIEAFIEKGYDATAFSTHIEQGTGVTSPITDRWAQLASIMTPVMDQIMTDGDVSILDDANRRVNETMQKSIGAQSQ